MERSGKPVVAAAPANALAPASQSELFESMLWDGGLVLLTHHLDRMEASAAALGWPCDRRTLEAELSKQTASCQNGQRYTVRIWLAPDGSVRSSLSLLGEKRRSASIKLANENTFSEDPLRQHRMTNRPLYDRAYLQARAEGHEDILFTNERGELTEGAIHNIFVEKEGKLLTPPLSCGVLPGVYRQHVLDTDPRAEERVLYRSDLKAADALYLSDSVHGFHQVTLED